MSDFAKYLRHVTDELNILNGDFSKMVAAKTKKMRDEASEKKDEETKGEGKAGLIKKTAQEQFKELSLKSLQPVTTLYKDKKEIERAKENPELDFVNKRLKSIFEGR